MLIERAVTEALDAVFSEKKLRLEKEASILWLGLSGGIDSTVLLHVAAKFSASANKQLNVIHVHHGLSSNADEWASHAEELCEKISLLFAINIRFIIEKVQLNNRTDGLEQAARLERYRIFSQYCGPNDVLLQGHHLDDQIETFFMRAIRGSGLTGLAGIPTQRNLSRNNYCQILRPLLSFEKSLLLEYAQTHQLSWVEDESNKDSKIDRNWWRNELLPKIWQRYPKQKQVLSRTLKTIQHEQSLLQQLVIEKIESHDAAAVITSKIHPALNALPRFDLDLIASFEQAVAISYLRAWLAQYVDMLPSALQMQSIYVDMIAARADGEPSFSWGKKSLYRYQGYLFLWHSKAVLINHWRDEVECCQDTQGLPYGLLTYQSPKSEHPVGLKPARYCIRTWQVGDTAKPVGRSTRKMKKWWQDYNVPSWVRHHWPIIVDSETDDIVAVPGLFVCQGYQVQKCSDEKNAWHLGWQFTVE